MERLHIEMKKPVRTGNLRVFCYCCSHKCLIVSCFFLLLTSRYNLLSFCAFFATWIGEIAIARDSFARSLAVMFVGKRDFFTVLVSDARKTKMALTECLLWWCHMSRLGENVWYLTFCKLFRTLRHSLDHQGICA